MFPDGIFAGIFDGTSGTQSAARSPASPAPGAVQRQTFALQSATAPAEETELRQAASQYTDLRVALVAAGIGFTLGAWAEWRSK